MNKFCKGKDSKLSSKVIDDIGAHPYEKKCLINPTAVMQTKVILWYHCYLQHLGENLLEETIVAVDNALKRHEKPTLKTCNSL